MAWRLAGLIAVVLALVAAAVAVLQFGFFGISTPGGPSYEPYLAGTCLTKNPVPLVLAIGARSNVPETSLPTLVTPLIGATADSGQPISLIRIDGLSEIFTPPPFHTIYQKPLVREQEIANYREHYIDPILTGAIRARVAQASVLTALYMAASAAGPDGNIIVIDSGLQTVAPLEYQQPGLLMAPADDVVAFLRQEDLLPNLTGRHVLISGFGYTAAPQPSLNATQRNNVVEQWVAIIRASGGCATADTVPNTAPEIPGLPPVGIVAPPTTPVFSNCGTIRLEDAGAVGFVAGSATFRDPSAAKATLGQLAVTLQHGAEHIALNGSTSSEGGKVLNDLLSLKRAKAVKALLVSLGIPASRITAAGDGSHWPGRVNDVGSDGVLLPGPAEQDYEVIVQLPHCT